MAPISITKRFFGTSRYMARLTFYHTRKHYSAELVVTIEIFDGRNSEGVFECTNIAEVAQKVMEIYQEKYGHPLEIRRLGRWFIEYLEDAKITPPEMNRLLKDMQSTPQEIRAREGYRKAVVEAVEEKIEKDEYTEAVVEEIERIADDAEEENEEFIEEALEEAQEEDDDDDALEEAVEEAIEEAIEDEDEIIEEVLEEVVEEELEDAIEEAVEDDGTVDEEKVEDAIEDIAEEIAEEVIEGTEGSATNEEDDSANKSDL
ncbi:MAG TPA: hypothetical protein VMX55_11520 [candidate division Zixibacteria bacterium]|nr:hypothetical protein [candidate division Zixibacteria bacterium]